MNVLSLVVAHIRYKKLGFMYHVILLAISLATILTITHINRQLDAQFQKNLQGIDLVVGAKGSPLQIILSSIFHLDIPTGNIPLLEADKLKRHPLVAESIPISLGDNYKGYRIVGTTLAYIDHYHGQLSQGHVFKSEMQVVVGSHIAHTYKLSIGDKIIGAHGLIKSDDLHTQAPYEVVGILKENGTVLDRLILTPIESVWHVHDRPEDADEHEHEHEHEHEESINNRAITALLIRYKSPMAAITLPRFINENSHLQAASPAFEVARLNKILNHGGDVMKVFGVLMVGVAAFGLFVTLSQAMAERQYDLMLIRSLGASRLQIAALILMDALAIAVAGIGVGLMFAVIITKMAGEWVAMQYHVEILSYQPEMTDLIICAGVLAIALIAALIPAQRAYSINMVDVLQKAA